MSRTTVTAVFVTYESAHCIDDALRQVQPGCDAGWLECIVVDNASTDNTVGIVRSHPWVRLIETGANLGYGRAGNVGWRHATTPYVLLLNPDVLIEPSAIQRLAAFLDEHPNAAVAGPALVRPDGSHQVAGAMATPWTIIRGAASASGVVKQYRRITPGDEPFRTNWLCGAAMMIRRSAMQRIGGFDPRFFLYFEETDLCRRMAESGGELWAVGEAVARHAGGESTRIAEQAMYTDCIAEHYFQSRYYYLIKHYGLIAATLTELAEVTLLGLRAGAAYVRRADASRHLERMRGPLFQTPPKECGT